MPDDTPTGKIRGKSRARMREAQVVELRLEGYDFIQIAEKVGYANSGSAWKAFDRAMESRKREAAGRVLGMELDRLDRLQLGIFKAGVEGDTKAANAMIRLMDHRAKLLGLYEQRGAVEVASAAEALAVFMREATDQFGDGADMVPTPEDVA